MLHTRPSALRLEDSAREAEGCSARLIVRRGALMVVYTVPGHSLDLERSISTPATVSLPTRCVHS